MREPVIEKIEGGVKVKVGEVAGGGASKAAQSPKSGGDGKGKADSEPQFKGSDVVAPEPEEPEPADAEPVEPEAQTADPQFKGQGGIGPEPEELESVQSEQSRD